MRDTGYLRGRVCNWGAGQMRDNLSMKAFIKAILVLQPVNILSSPSSVTKVV